MPKDRRPPAFLFYPSDFTSDANVEAMTTEAVGAYMLLLCKAWQQQPVGTLPTDDAVLARWARVTKTRWSKLKPMVVAAFALGEDGRLHQKRLKREYEKLRESSRKKADSGRVGADSRWQRHDGAMRLPMANDGISSTTPSSSSNPDPPHLGKTRTTRAECDAAAVAAARSLATGWITANCPKHLRRYRGLMDFIAEFGKERAFADSEAALSEPNVTDPFAWALARARGERDRARSNGNGRAPSRGDRDLELVEQAFSGDEL